MKTIRLIAMLMALITVLCCFASCGDQIVNNFEEPEETTKDPYPNHMQVNIVVYAATEKDKDTGLYNVLDENNLIPIIGAPAERGGLSVGYNNGEAVTAATVLKQLAALRKATLEFASSGNINTITMNKVKYETASVVNTNRKATIEIDKVKTDVYYKDMVMWDWNINGKTINNIGDAEIKDGDTIVLTLVLDNTTEGQNYQTVEEYNAENGLNTTAPSED